MSPRTDIVAGLAALAVDLDNDPRIPLPRDAQHGIAIVFSVASRTEVYAAAETQDVPVTQTRDANGARHTTAMLRYGGAVTLHVFCLEDAPAGWDLIPNRSRSLGDVGPNGVLPSEPMPATGPSDSGGVTPESPVRMVSGVPL